MRHCNLNKLYIDLNVLTTLTVMFYISGPFEKLIENQ